MLIIAFATLTAWAITGSVSGTAMVGGIAAAMVAHQYFRNSDNRATGPRC